MEILETSLRVFSESILIILYFSLKKGYFSYILGSFINWKLKRIHFFDTFIYCICDFDANNQILKRGDQFKSGLTIYIDIDNDLIYNVLRGL